MREPRAERRERKMTGAPVVVSGGSGLIGSALRRALQGDGVPVVSLVRRPPTSADEVRWAPGERPLDPEVLAGARAVVNLNGASIGRLPWTRDYRETLRTSRIAPTRTLATALRELGADAPILLSASAVGIYGDRPGEPLDERSEPGRGFLPELCVEWEAEARASSGPVALLRTASVLHERAVLGPLVRIARLGGAGPLGGGRQVWPWISLADEVRAIRHVLEHGVTGPVNLCGPEPATAGLIVRAVARALRRPALLPAPAFALRLALGREAADALLLADARVDPAVLRATGFAFTSPTAPVAIAAELAGGSPARDRAQVPRTAS